jgi:hypothetical protein
MANVIPEGYELLVGRSRDKAREAIETAQERGFPVESVLTQRDGYLIPLDPNAEPATAEAQEIVLPKDSDNHQAIDDFAEKYGLSYDGIEAKDPTKPTKVEKIAHLAKALEAKAAENDAHLEATGEATPVGEDAGDQTDDQSTDTAPADDQSKED